jgi:hypothetical protein
MRANYLYRETEILDVAPIDLLNGSSRDFVNNLSDRLVSPEMKQQAFDLEFHWVTENVNNPARMTSGIRIMPTVSL